MEIYVNQRKDTGFITLSIKPFPWKRMLRRTVEYFSHHEYNQSVLATFRFLITKIKFATEK